MCDNLGYTTPEEIKNLNKSILAVSVNVRSLNCNWDKLLSFLNSLSTKPDVVCLQEIWAKTTGRDYSIPGYESPIIKDRYSVIKKKGGGLALYLRHGVQGTIINSHFDQDLESLSIECTINKKKFKVVNIYRPPKSKIRRSLQIIEQICESTQRYSNALIIGDTNICAKKATSHASELTEIMTSNGFLLSTQEYTRVTEETKSLIDHIWVKQSNTSSYLSTVIPESISDHFIPALMDNRTPTIVKSSQQLQYRKISPENIELLKRSLNTTDWSSVIEANDVNEATENFIQLFTNAFNKNCPEVNRNVNKNYDAVQPWISKGLLVSRLKKNKLIKIAAQTKTREDIKKKNEFIKVYNKLIKEAKEIYYKAQLYKTQNDPKKSWQTVNSILHRSNKNSDRRVELEINGSITKNEQIVAERFNEHFTTMAKEATAHIKPNKDFKEYLGLPNVTFFKTKLASPNDILKIIKSFKSKTSTGVDGLSNKILKTCQYEIIPYIQHIVNLSITTGKVPKQFKTAKVIPIPKSGSRLQVNNYRPISLLPALSKILEKWVDNQLRDFLNKEGIIPENQFGFRSGHSCEHALQKIVCYIQESKRKNLKVAGVFLDISKAFDSCQHSIILHKLHHYGIRGLEYEWFKDYFQERKQFVHINGKTSSTVPLSLGVGQGSILGPTIFLCYIADLIKNTDLFSILFADDTTLLHSAKSLKQLQNELQDKITKVEDWYEANFLALHPLKTKYILFYPQRNENMSLKMLNNNLERIGEGRPTTYFKLLGVLIDENLKWSYHVDKIKSKVMNGALFLSKLIPYSTVQLRRQVYYALVETHLQYALTLWGGKGSSNVKLLRAQKSAIRKLSPKGVKKIHTEPLCYENGILMIKDLYTFCLQKASHSIKHNQCPQALKTVIKWRGSSESRRGIQAVPPKVRTENDKVQIDYQIAKKWNDLPINHKLNMSKVSFARKSKQSIVSTYKQNVKCNNILCAECSV